MIAFMVSMLEIFFNVITTTLYNPIIIQIICQTFPILILQILNNLMNEEHKHSFHLRGVLNFSTVISGCFILNVVFLYLRDKQKLLDKDANCKNSDKGDGSFTQLSSTEISENSNSNIISIDMPERISIQ